MVVDKEVIPCRRSPDSMRLRLHPAGVRLGKDVPGDSDWRLAQRRMVHGGDRFHDWVLGLRQGKRSGKERLL
ncbi:MAG: hypothetical protein EOM02_10590 [Synergistales bacterium]|nr:hypothetical protein [Synergistales bacterium]